MADISIPTLIHSIFLTSVKAFVNHAKKRTMMSIANCTTKSSETFDGGPIHCGSRSSICCRLGLSWKPHLTTFWLDGISKPRQAGGGAALGIDVELTCSLSARKPKPISSENAPLNHANLRTTALERNRPLAAIRNRPIRIDPVCTHERRITSLEKVL